MVSQVLKSSNKIDIVLIGKGPETVAIIIILTNTTPFKTFNMYFHNLVLIRTSLLGRRLIRLIDMI